MREKLHCLEQQQILIEGPLLIIQSPSLPIAYRQGNTYRVERACDVR
jgi:hypothetical protein